jgi:hypothetical protein
MFYGGAVSVGGKRSVDISSMRYLIIVCVLTATEQIDLCAICNIISLLIQIPVSFRGTLFVILSILLPEICHQDYG